MKQPTKKKVINPIKKTKKKKNKGQPIKRDIKFFKYGKYKVNTNIEKDPKSSNLEVLFEEMFLKKLKLTYTKQFHTPIGRYYDFYLPKYQILIEVDGDFWHCNPKKYEKPINAIQVRNKRIDEIKNSWAFINSYKLLRFWEDDIKNRPNIVMNRLKKEINYLQSNKKI